MSKNSNLKRVRNVFEGFSFQDDASPVNRDESEPSNKFQRMSSNHTVQSLLESVSRNNSEESPWLETRAASRMDSHEKAKNIAVAIEQRKKTGKPDMTVFSRIPTKGFGLEDVTRLSEEDETAKKKTDLSRILSKSNLIRTSLLNQSVDDLEDYDPVNTFREKIQENRVVERMQRKDHRVNSSSSEVGNRRNRIIFDSDEENEEESRFSNNNGFNHKAEFQRKQTDESAFGEETPQELERTKKLSKLTKNNNKQSAAISLLDSDEDVQPKKSSKSKKNKKELTKKVVLIDSDEEQDEGRQNNSDEEEEESTNWRDMSKADIKQKALEIIDKCKNLSKNLRSSLQRWEGRKSDDGKSNDCINLIEIKDDSATASDNSSSPDGSRLIKVSDIKILCPDLTLNSYQLVGVNWLKLLYENQMNGVLADDMGLGKTIQTIAFLTYLSKSKQNSCKLPHFIVVPASTLANWENEFHKFAPSMTLIKYHGSQQERQDLRQEIKDMIRHGELDVILSTYTMFERESNKLDRGFIQSLKFNFLVLDEAHSIKNSDSSRYYHLNNLETRYRLLLSGTPVQNNLMELLALLSFLMPNLFLKEHCQILMEVFSWSLGSGERNREGGFNSKEEMKALMDLKSILSPFVLRRLKSDVLNQLSEKRYVLQKIPMNEYQATVYNNIILQYLQKKETDKANFLESLDSKDPEKQKGKGRGRKKKDDGDESKKNGPTSSGIIDLSESPVKSASAPQNVIKGGITATEAKHLFTSLRKAANHPLLLRIHYTTEKVKKIGKIAFQQEYFGKQCSLQQVMNELENNFSDYDLHELCLQFPQYLSNEILDESTLYQSPKMNYLSTLLPQLIQEDHRILLFSQWTRLLDLLEILLNALDLKFLRLDGSTPIKERQRLIDEYSGDTTISVFLLSTKAGGLGINLTAADTVILHDLDFNPENDKQAEDRCYRIGQTKPVTIYKLVTEGSVDEDIYEMGERKSQLSQAVLSNKNNNGESKQQDKEEDVNLISQILAKALNRK